MAIKSEMPRKADGVNGVTQSCGRAGGLHAALSPTGRDQVEDTHYRVDARVGWEELFDIGRSLKDDRSSRHGAAPVRFQGIPTVDSPVDRSLGAHRAGQRP